MTTTRRTDRVPDAITYNPFRVLGLPASASEREIQKQIRTLTRYAEVGKTCVVDLDLPSLPEIERTVELVQTASAQIEQAQDRLGHALFWFTGLDPVDEVALASLADGAVDKARAIWNKVSTGDLATKRQISAQNNLSTLDMIDAFNASGAAGQASLASSLRGKSALIAPDPLRLLAPHVVGAITKLDPKETLSAWATDIETALRSSGLASNTGEVFGVFHACASSVRREIANQFELRPRRDIESAVRTCEDRREESPKKADRYAKTLFAATAEPLAALEQIRGRDSVQYELLSDSVAEEILVCGLDYFNELRDSNTDPGKNTKRCFDMAHKRACGSTLRERIAENQKGVAEWIDDADDREQRRKIDPISEELRRVFEQFERDHEEMMLRFSGTPWLGIDPFRRIEKFLDACDPKLSAMAAILGARNSIVLMMSDSVVYRARGCLVDLVNAAQKIAARDELMLLELPTVLARAAALTARLRRLDIGTEAQAKISADVRALQNLCSQFAEVTGGRAQQSGCYIATMAYGDPDHTDVRALRAFRDRHLLPNRAGAMFVRWYYKYSPGWVSFCRDMPAVHRALRKTLQYVVRRLPK